MRKLFVTALLMIGMTSFAQQEKSERQPLTAEQRTEIRVKRLTSDLELNDTQQKQVAAVIEKQVRANDAFREKRKASKAEATKLTPEQRAELKKEVLDSNAQFEQELKKILTPVQLEKWEKRKEKAEVGKRNAPVKSKDSSK